MIRVAQMTLTMGQGGIENLILSMAQHQNKNLFQTYLYCLDAGGELLEPTRQKGATVRVFSRKPGLDLGLVWRLAKSLRADGVQVLHTHNQASHFYGCLAGRMARVPVVINTEHSRHNTEGVWRRKLEKRFLAMLSDRLVTVSEELKAATVERDGFAPDKLTVVENGIDVEKFASILCEDGREVRCSLGINADTKVVSIIARLHPIKNHDLLLKAIQIVRQSLPEVQLLIIGDGELRNELENHAAVLGVAPWVHFLGNRLDVPALMKASDLLVLCSQSEGLPLVLLEGMAAGVPFVLSHGANRAGLFQHGISGLVCQPQADDLANSILLVLANPARARTMAQRAREEISKRYSIQHTVSRYDEIYRDLLSSRGCCPDMQKG